MEPQDLALFLTLLQFIALHPRLHLRFCLLQNGNHILSLPNTHRVKETQTCQYSQRASEKLNAQNQSRMLERKFPDSSVVFVQPNHTTGVKTTTRYPSLDSARVLAAGGHPFKLPSGPLGKQPLMRLLVKMKLKHHTWSSGFKGKSLSTPT